MKKQSALFIILLTVLFTVLVSCSVQKQITSYYTPETNTEYKLLEMENKNNYSKNIVIEFIKNYYPNTDLKIYKAVESLNYFKYKLENTNSKENSKVIFLNWTNWSDGLEWNFWIEEQTRNNLNKKGVQKPFEIIRNEEVKQKIKTYLLHKTNIKQLEKADVFYQKKYSFVTQQSSSNLNFPVKNTQESENYAVFMDNELYTFSMEGNVVENTD